MFKTLERQRMRKNLSNEVGGGGVVFFWIIVTAVLIASLVNMGRMSASDIEERMGLKVHEEVAKHKILKDQSFKMVIGDDENQSLDSLKKLRNTDSTDKPVKEKPTPQEIEIAEVLVDLESELGKDLEDFLSGQYIRSNEIIMNDQYQLISANGNLSFVNYNGWMVEAIAPPTQEEMSEVLVKPSAVYESIVSPIETYLATNPDMLTVDTSIIVGDKDGTVFTPPAHLAKKYSQFENMLENNLSQFLSDSGEKKILDNDLLIQRQYQFYLEDGKWELVNYDGETINLDKLYKDNLVIDEPLTVEDYEKYR